MLAEYLEGTVPQLVERARLLKGKIPRGLPRDYEALIKTCHDELDNIIARLRDLQLLAPTASLAVRHAKLRQFKRAVADLDIIETRAIAALHRVHDDDHHANRLLYRICQEIAYPVLPPTVSTLSSGYFYIDPRLNLLFIPPAEGSFLLHLPDLYHELAHPLLVHKDHPVLERLSQRFLEVTARVHDHFAERRDTEARRRGPQSFKDEIDVWEILWTKWLVEFFCDLFAVFTLGPAFVWSHLHLFMKMGKDPHEMPTPFRPATHPADDARMRALLAALRLSGFQEDAAGIEARWREVLRLANASPSPNYPFCYPDDLIGFMVTAARQGVAEMQCRMAAPGTADPIHLLLNEAWTKFWSNPASYHQWEKGAVAQLRTSCNSDQPTRPVVDVPVALPRGEHTNSAVL
jgi:hypothetical protein